LENIQLQHQVSFVQSTMKYVFIMRLFHIVDANIFFYKLVKITEH